MDDLSEKEQIEEIRRWWSEYGNFFLGGVVVCVGGIFGWNYYSGSQLDSQIAASDLYEELTVDISAGNLEDAEALRADIVTNHGDTVYAGQSGLAIARLYMDRNRDQDAADALLTVVESDSDDAVKNVARLRLARIYLYQEKPQEAIDLLSAGEDEAFSAAYGEVIGDAYAQLGQVADAETAYQGVLANENAQGTVDLALIQWKLLDLPAADAVVAEESAEEEVTEEVTEEVAAEESE